MEVMNRREILATFAALPAINVDASRPGIVGVGVLRYPVGVENSKMARNIAGSIRQGAIIAFDNTTDEHGNFLWDFRIEGGDPGQVKIERQGE